jgi:hypothetical protein
MRLLGLGCLAMLAWPRLAQASEAADSVQNYLVGRPDLILCLTYSIAGSESLHDELVRRNLLNAADVKALSTRAITGEMSECGLLAVRGRPLRIAHDYDHIFEKLHRDFGQVGPYDVVYLVDMDPGLETWALVKDGVVTRIVGAIVD